MGCLLSHVQMLFGKSHDKEERSSMFRRNSRSREVLLKCQASTILTPAKQRGGSTSSVPYACLEEANGEGLTLEDAVNRRDKELLQRLILAGCVQDLFNVHNKPEKVKRNPVELACTLGFTDIVEVFLQNGCSPNLPTSHGRLIHSLLEAMKCSSVSLEDGRRLIQVLCDNGCDVNIRDVRYNTTLLYAAEFGDYVVLEMILERCKESQLTYRCGGSSYTPLHMSAMRGDSDCVRLLLQYFPNKHVNIQDGYGNTALLLALKAMCNNLEYLNSAKVNMENQSGTRSVHWLKEKERLLKFQHCSISIVESLLLAGADVSINSNTAGQFIGMLPSFSPLCYALYLCTLDETNGFEDVSNDHKYTDTIQLVSMEKIQDLEKWSKQSEKSSASLSLKEDKFSVYAGVVRLIVLSGSQLEPEEREVFIRYPTVIPLLEEIGDFWTQYQLSRPAKLMHLAKQALRNHLASLQALHKLDNLPLPERLKGYVKLNCL